MRVLMTAHLYCSGVVSVGCNLFLRFSNRCTGSFQRALALVVGIIAPPRAQDIMSIAKGPKRVKNIPVTLRLSERAVRFRFW